MSTVRETNSAGPCVTLGEFIRETARFYVYRDNGIRGRRGEERKVAKRAPGRYSGAHVEPCSLCGDHPQTQYPHGYMD